MKTDMAYFLRAHGIIDPSVTDAAQEFLKGVFTTNVKKEEDDKGYGAYFSVDKNEFAVEVDAHETETFFYNKGITPDGWEHISIINIRNVESIDSPTFVNILLRNPEVGIFMMNVNRDSIETKTKVCYYDDEALSHLEIMERITNRFPMQHPEAIEKLKDKFGIEGIAPDKEAISVDNIRISDAELGKIASLPRTNQDNFITLFNEIVTRQKENEENKTILY